MANSEQDTTLESSESGKRKRKLTKEETDARLAHRHGKHLKEASQNTYITKKGNTLNSGTPTYNLQGNKRVPSFKATKRDQQAGQELLSEMQTLIPGLDPLKAGYKDESYTTRRDRLHKLCCEYYITDAAEFNMTWAEFCDCSKQAEEELQSFVRLDPNEEMAIRDERCTDFLSSVGEDTNVAHGTRRNLGVPTSMDVTKKPSKMQSFVSAKKILKDEGVGGKPAEGTYFAETPCIREVQLFSGNCNASFVPHVTSICSDAIHEDSKNGFSVWTSGPKVKLAGAQPPTKSKLDGFQYDLTPEEAAQFNELRLLAEKCKEHLKREPSVLNCCINFFAFGTKVERNARQVAMYAMKGQSMAFTKAGSSSTKWTKQDNKLYGQAIHVYEQMRAFCINVILPKLKHFLFLEMMAVELFFKSKGVGVWSNVFCGATMGKYFWPTSHLDDDLTYTGLLCFDTVPNGVLGGDWSFITLGHVLKARHGCLFLYGGWIRHCTTKMMVNKKLAHLNPYRYYCAFFGKKSVCQAIGTSVATAERKAQQKAQQKAR